MVIICADGVSSSAADKHRKVEIVIPTRFGLCCAPRGGDIHEVEHRKVPTRCCTAVFIGSRVLRKAVRRRLTDIYRRRAKEGVDARARQISHPNSISQYEFEK